MQRSPHAPGQTRPWHDVCHQAGTFLHAASGASFCPPPCPSCLPRVGGAPRQLPRQQLPLHYSESEDVCREKNQLLGSTLPICCSLSTAEPAQDHHRLPTQRTHCCSPEARVARSPRITSGASHLFVGRLEGDPSCPSHAPDTHRGHVDTSSDAWVHPGAFAVPQLRNRPPPPPPGVLRRQRAAVGGVLQQLAQPKVWREYGGHR